MRKNKILFLLEDYNLFYTKEAKLILEKKQSHYESLIENPINYQDVLTELINRKHYQSDSMANAFKALENETKIVVPEANPLQLLWAKENNTWLYIKWLLEKPLRSFKSRVLKQHRTSYNTIQFDILLAQVKTFAPDIIYFYSNIFITEAQILQLKTYCKKIVLQWSCPIWREQPTFPYHLFDLIITAAPQLKAYFDEKKYNCIYLQQAFDESVLNTCEEKKEPIGDVVFIGGFVLGHHYRFEILEALLKANINLTIYGIGKESLPKDSLVYNAMKEPIYGIDMYNKYRKYKMSIHINGTGYSNDGIDWSKYAGAKRLFEITGAGTLLLTSHQENIKELFEIDKEVVTFKTADELIEKIKYYLANPEIAGEVAKNGMQRTLSSHSFRARAKELNTILFN